MAKKECESSEIHKKKTFQNRSLQSSTAKGDRVRPVICFIILFFGCLIEKWEQAVVKLICPSLL
jgi:hypothetical protein